MGEGGEKYKLEVLKTALKSQRSEALEREEALQVCDLKDHDLKDHVYTMTESVCAFVYEHDCTKVRKGAKKRVLSMTLHGVLD
jgi:hypothetical protein